MNMKKIKLLLPYIISLLTAVLMTLASELTGEKEIIFPEITALAIGYIVAEKRSWHVNSIRIVVLITLCAIAGVLIVRSRFAGILPEILIAFALCQLIFMYSGTTFAPFVSAVILPIMMQTESFVYPASAFVLTLIIVALHTLFLKCGIRSGLIPKQTT